MPAPGAPSSFAVTITGRKGARLTWTDGANTDLVLIYRNTVDVFGSSSVVGVVEDGVQRFVESALAPGVTFFWWLKPVSTDTLGSATASVTGTTAGDAGVPGDAVVGTIIEAIKARIEDLLSSDFVQLKDVRNPKKNPKVPWGWGVYPAAADPSEASVFGAYTLEQTFTVLLLRSVAGSKGDRQVEQAEQDLAQWQDRLTRDFISTKFYETLYTVQVKQPTIQAAEYLEDGEVVALRIDYKVTYRNLIQ